MGKGMAFLVWRMTRLAEDVRGLLTCGLVHVMALLCKTWTVSYNTYTNNKLGLMYTSGGGSPEQRERPCPARCYLDLPSQKTELRQQPPQVRRNEEQRKKLTCFFSACTCATPTCRSIQRRTRCARQLCMETETEAETRQAYADLAPYNLAALHFEDFACFGPQAQSRQTLHS